MKSLLVSLALVFAASNVHAIESQRVVVRQASYDLATWELVGLSSETGPIRPMSEITADYLLKLNFDHIYKCDAKFYHESLTKTNLVYSLSNCEIF